MAWGKGKSTLTVFLVVVLALYFIEFLLPNRASAAVQITLYASPTGSGNVCSLSAPCSLTGARDQARTLNSNMTGDIIIYLLDGTYTLSSTFQLTESSTVHDSGTNGYNIIYKANPGSSPIISGGQTITGWSLYNSGKNIYRASVGTSFDTRQLYVNGVRAIRARSAMNPTGWTKTGTGYTAPDSTMASWGNIGNIEIVSRNNWREYRCGISSISGTTVTMQQPCWNNSNRESFNTITNPAWIENAYELLDSEGEWYLDRSSGYLYYKPYTNENMSTASIIAPTLETLLSGAGTYATPLKNIQFYGITFSYATWLRPNTSEGYAPLQAGFLHYGSDGGNQNTDMYKTPGNVTFSAVQNVRLERNVFTHLGAAALSFEYGSQNNTVVGNRFQDISGSGIELGHMNDEGHLVTSYYNDNDNGITYTGSFTYAGNRGVGDYKNDVTQTQNNNDYFQFTFTGTGINYYGVKNTDIGNQDVYIDGVLQSTVNGYASSYTTSLMYSKTGLTSGQHTIKVVKKSGSWMVVDALGVYTETDPTVKLVKNNTLSNNYITQIAQEYHDAVGIMALYTDSSNITHNEITNVPYSGISMGWGWGAPDAGGSRGWATATVAQNNTIQYNYVHDFMKTLNDGGGIYTLSSQANSTINNNYVRDDHNQYGALYLDNGSSNFNVNHNVVASIPSYVWWLDIGPPSSNNDVEYNYTDSSNKYISQPQNNTVINNQEGLTSWPTAAQTIMNSAGLESNYQDIIPVVDDKVDDNDPSITYSGTWTAETNDVGNYKNTVHWSSATTSGAYAQFTFTGSSITWIGKENQYSGVAKVYIDGVLDQTVNTYSSSQIFQQSIYTKTGLSVGQHTIKIVSDSAGNGGYYSIHIDALKPYVNIVDDNDPSITYSGTWTAETNDVGNYKNTVHWSSATTSGAYAQFTFTGSSITWIGKENQYSGVAKVYIDGVLDQTVNTYSSSQIFQQSIYTKTGLSAGQHTIKIVSDSAGNGGYYSIHIDAFHY
ncbi:right-handed parallel beta-helix repeat-containing protein [Cohnella silvisoli]|uniref:Right handed beta helix domain-containing protein n=1 Tax=Cohnella silvisoli TaxID=2873699 RepID=A0ABV1KVN2_9BACL|nr:right-handed parallel beta-helix repeat-containing protein [Cohnella silvisoli]MCD9023507.1 hypothetical protein [Cohnella silvisoli]